MSSYAPGNAVLAPPDPSFPRDLSVPRSTSSFAALLCVSSAGQVKCSQYFPEQAGGVETFQHMRVTTLSAEPLRELPSIVERQLLLEDTRVSPSRPRRRCTRGSACVGARGYMSSIGAAQREGQALPSANPCAQTAVKTSLPCDGALLLEQPGGLQSKIFHYHYLEWPDHGVPQSAEAIRMLNRHLRNSPEAGGPFIVHCRYA